MGSMSAVSSVLAVGVLQGQPVNSVPQVPLDCIAKSGCLCSVLSTTLSICSELRVTMYSSVCCCPHMDAVMKGLSGATLDQHSSGKGQDCW